MRKVVSGLVSFEGLGLAPHFRRAVQAGEIEVEEYSEHTLICRLQAQAYRLPFVPTKAGLGTDMVDLHPETTRVETDPATGETYVACTPLAVDVAIVHAHAGDARWATSASIPKLVWMDNEVVNAAATTIGTVERIIDHGRSSPSPHRTTYPRFMVDAVVEAPWGAYPDLVLPDLRPRHARSSTPTARRCATRWSGSVLGGAGRRPGDAGRVPRRQRRRPVAGRLARGTR